MAWIHASATAAALRLGRNSFALAFKLRGGTGTAAKSKMEHFLIIVNGWKSFVNYYHKALHLGCCSSHSWIGWIINFVPTCIWTALTTSSFPVIPYQSSDDLCSLIHLWLSQYHQYLLFLFCLCIWYCVFLEGQGIHVSIFSMRPLYIVVRIFIFLSIRLNYCLEWKLM